MPTDDKKKKVASKGAGKEALKSALDKATTTGKMQKTKQPIMRANKTIEKNLPRLVLKRSVRYGKDRVKDPKVAARNDDQERGANLKKVKVKAKTVATKKASPVKAGKMTKPSEGKSKRGRRK